MSISRNMISRSARKDPSEKFGSKSISDSRRRDFPKFAAGQSAE